ncbi:MAG: ester cyclase [Chloroflexi bacterium]|nr:ester cyclase [Chloroflexota bacterium]
MKKIFAVMLLVALFGGIFFVISASADMTGSANSASEKASQAEKVCPGKCPSEKAPQAEKACPGKCPSEQASPADKSSICECAARLEKNKGLIEKFYKAAVKNDQKTMDSCFAGGYVIEDLGALRDKKNSSMSETNPEIKARIDYLHKALPGFTIEIKEMVAEGDRVFAHVVMTGVQKGVFMGIAPTDKELTMEAFVLYEIKDGKITRAVEMWNQLGMMKQMGYIKID